MDSQGFLFVFCIVIFNLYLHIVSAHRGLELQNLNRRIKKMEITYEYEIRMLRMQLDEQTSKISELEMLLNSTGAHSSDTQVHLFSAVTRLEKTDLKAEDIKRLSKSLKHGFLAQKKTFNNLSESIKQNLTRVVDLEKAVDNMKNDLDKMQEDVAERFQQINLTVVNCYQKAVNGQWSQWSSWGACSASCDIGMWTRTRTCSDPAPANGGNVCIGNDRDTGECVRPVKDCSELCHNNRENGTYDINPYGDRGASLSVYCVFDMDGVWTVIQKRFNGSVNFTRSWADYKSGFGNGNGEYWIGNDALHKITSLGNYKLKVVLTDWDGVTKYAMYRVFRVANEADGYRLTVEGYTGDAGDAMTEEGATSSDVVHNGMQFSTIDRDNDKAGYSCATWYEAGWWYNNCMSSNLNGPYSRTAFVTWRQGIVWYQWRGPIYSLKETAMMIRMN